MADINDIQNIIDGLPEWATEKTLSDLLRVMQSTGAVTKTQAKDAGKALNNIAKNSNKSREQQKSSLSELKALVKGNKESTKAEEKAEKRRIAAEKANRKFASSEKYKDVNDRYRGKAWKAGRGVESGIGGISSMIGGGIGEINAPMGKVAGMFGNLGGKLSKLNPVVGILSAGFGLLSAVVGRAWKVFTNTLKTMVSLNEVGIGYANSVRNMIAMSSNMSLTMEEFEAAVGRSAQAIGYFGLKTFSDIAAGLGGANNVLKKYAVTVAEAAEYTAAELDMRRMGGMFDKRNEKEMQEAVAGNIKALSIFSKITNKTRQQMLEEQKALLARADVEAYMAGLSQEQAAAYKTNLQNLAWMPAEMQGGMAEMMSNIYGPRNTQYLQDIQATGASNVAKAMEDIAMQQKDAAERGVTLTMEQQDANRVKLAQALRQDHHILQRVGSAGGQYADLALKLAGSTNLELNMQERNLKRLEEEWRAKKLADKNYKVTQKEYIEQAGIAAQTAVDFDNSLAKLKVMFDRVIISFIQSLTGEDGFTKVLDFAAGVAKDLANWLAKISEPGGMENFWKEIIDAIEPIMNKVGAWLFTGMKEAIFGTPEENARRAELENNARRGFSMNNTSPEETQEMPEKIPGTAQDPKKVTIQKKEQAEADAQISQAEQKKIDTMKDREEILREIARLLSESLLIDKKLLRKVGGDLY